MGNRNSMSASINENNSTASDPKREPQGDLNHPRTSSRDPIGNPPPRSRKRRKVVWGHSRESATKQRVAAHGQSDSPVEAGTRETSSFRRSPVRRRRRRIRSMESDQRSDRGVSDLSSSQSVKTARNGKWKKVVWGFSLIVVILTCLICYGLKTGFVKI